MGFVDKVAAGLSPVYNFFFQLDRKTRGRTRLRAPVVSVGNIAMGGRAKTPTVIWLCRELKKQGWEPVVLTRGYKRKSKDLIWILPTHETLNLKTNSRRKLDEQSVSECGDEAIEISLKASVPVLVSSNRVKNAKQFLAEGTFHPDRLVFVLDDGFQHWSLLRDYDLVLIQESDRSAALVPHGPLRERAVSLGRADRVLTLGKDLTKHTILPASLLEALKKNPKLYLITSRAPDQSYQTDIAAQLPKDTLIQSIRFDDHASRGVLFQELNLRDKGDIFAVGYKEAVKLCPPLNLLPENLGTQQSVISSSGHTLYLIDLELEVAEADQLLGEIVQRLRVKL